MPKPRYTPVSFEAIPSSLLFTLCTSNFSLCFDTGIGENYKHRKQWLEDKRHEAITAFVLGFCGYA